MFKKLLFIMLFIMLAPIMIPFYICMIIIKTYI